jgi:ABC-type proline/glycine betaine transport system permease subunit
MDFARPFRSDPLRHEGVRPFHVWGLRVFYALIVIGVAPTAWGVLLSHRGEWQPLSAVAWSVWATYPVLAVFGLFHPLRWLPLMFFTVGYKSVWMAFVAWPLLQAGTMQGAPAQPVFESFLALPLLALVIPWGYAWNTYVVGKRPAPGQALAHQGA